MLPMPIFFCGFKGMTQAALNKSPKLSKVGVKILKEYFPLDALRTILIYSHKILQAKCYKKMKKY